jgi:hypothetical protein
LAGLTGIVDAIGNLADTRAGLAVLTVHYSADVAHNIPAENGILVVSCNIAGPAPVIEGSTATKGVVDYADPFFPISAAQQNPALFNTYGNTLFHVMPNED